MIFQKPLSKPTLYLDIDGVLNGMLETTFSFESDRNKPIFSDDLLKRFRRGDCVNIYKLTLLRNFINLYNIEVVNISSWIRTDNIELNLKTLSEFFGFTISRWATSSGGDRATPVLDDIVNFGVDNFVILDDAERMYEDKPNHPFYKNKPYYSLYNNLVIPHGRYGLNESDIDKCGQILGFHFFDYVPTYCSNIELLWNNFYEENK